MQRRAPTYEYEVAYRDGDGEERTLVLDSEDVEALDEGQTVTILVDPDRAGDPVVLEALPCEVPVDSTGEIGPLGPRGWLWAALPLAVTLAVGSAILVLL